GRPLNRAGAPTLAVSPTSNVGGHGSRPHREPKAPPGRWVDCGWGSPPRTRDGAPPDDSSPPVASIAVTQRRRRHGAARAARRPGHARVTSLASGPAVVLELGNEPDRRRRPRGQRRGGRRRPRRAWLGDELAPGRTDAHHRPGVDPGRGRWVARPALRSQPHLAGGVE